LVSDDVGNLNTINFQSQVNDPWYKELKEKIANQSAPGGTGTNPAAAGNPALINEIGGR
jgi:hypothetical protein